MALILSLLIVFLQWFHSTPFAQKMLKKIIYKQQQYKHWENKNQENDSLYGSFKQEKSFQKKENNNV
jgi:hypothetical protein